MINFTYRSGRTEKTGTMTLITSEFPIECEINANGWYFHVIVGKHSNGNYICIPNWSIGSELASLDDSFWNCERLTHYSKFGKQNSIIIASALKELSKNI
ncbi:MAG: hypothetical protein IJK95_00850 [Firmicutes bacterium]|nr:hypothetical protein [Bacillota bacterium]